MIKAVLFDLGDTLYHYQGLPLSWQDHHQMAWAQGLRRTGMDSRDYDLDLAAHHMNRFNTRLHPRETELDSATIFGEACDLLGLDRRHLDRLIDGYFTYFRQSLSAFPESSRVLVSLRQAGLATGALTDVAYGMPERFVADDLHQCGLIDLLDVWCTSVQVGFRKPHPQGYLTLCEVLRIAPDQALYVGNEQKDVAGAKAAGLRAALVWREKQPIPSWGQDFNLADLSALSAIATAPCG